jgi:hypothetical protein
MVLMDGRKTNMEKRRESSKERREQKTGMTEEIQKIVNEP